MFTRSLFFSLSGNIRILINHVDGLTILNDTLKAFHNRPPNRSMSMVMMNLRMDCVIHYSMDQMSTMLISINTSDARPEDCIDLSQIITSFD